MPTGKSKEYLPLCKTETRVYVSLPKLDNSVNAYGADTITDRFDPSWLVKGNNETRMVTGFAIKKDMHYDLNITDNPPQGVSGKHCFQEAPKRCLTTLRQATKTQRKHRRHCR